MDIRMSEKGLPILDQFSEDGFVDCVLKITDLEERESSYRFCLRAFYGDADLGFGVEVVKGIDGGFDAEMSLIQDHVYWQGIRFFRTGPESDELLTVLARLYGFADVSLTMNNEVTFTAIALHQVGIDMTAEPIKIKIFGNDQDDDPEDDYYESYFNLDLINGFVFWNEKDQDYRKPLIRGLSA